MAIGLSILTTACIRTHFTIVTPVLVINISLSRLLLIVLICTFWKQKVKTGLAMLIEILI